MSNKNYAPSQTHVPFTVPISDYHAVAKARQLIAQRDNVLLQIAKTLNTL
jgi:hypothetical protein